jgi:hypothetical protein
MTTTMVTMTPVTTVIRPRKTCRELLKKRARRRRLKAAKRGAAKGQKVKLVVVAVAVVKVVVAQPWTWQRLL